MSNIEINPDELKPGQILWVVKSLRTNTSSPTGGYVERGVIYPFEVKEVELFSFKKGFGGGPDERHFNIKSEVGELYYRTGTDGSYNPELYLNRDDAVASVKDWHTSYLEDQEKEFEEARIALELRRAIAHEEVIEIPEEAMNTSWIDEALENKAKLAAGEPVD